MSMHEHSGHGAHPHANDGHATANAGRVLIAACLTGGFMLAEVAGGLITGSLALLADAGHMLTDTVSLGLAWYAFRLAGRVATARLTYGFDRVKTLVAYTNGIAVFAIGAWIVMEALQRFQDPPAILGGPMLAIAVLGLLVNVGAFAVLAGGDRKSLNMRGAILHVVGDLLGSVAALVAAAVILTTGWLPVDPLLSVLVALLLFRSAWSLVRESAHLLLEGVPGDLDRDGIARDLADNVQGLREVHHMHLWSLDGSKNVATLHACLADGVDSQRAVREIKLRLSKRHGIEHATVEPEFGRCADAAPEH
ncbi:MAG: cation efflux system protein [Rhizobiaceae bacterium]|nr:cation efflux system protein [Rhizobiaceae bacterium]